MPFAVQRLEPLVLVRVAAVTRGIDDQQDLAAKLAQRFGLAGLQAAELVIEQRRARAAVGGVRDHGSGGKQGYGKQGCRKERTSMAAHRRGSISAMKVQYIKHICHRQFDPYPTSPVL